MGRQVDIDDLVSAADLADRLGYKNTAAFHVVRLRDDEFPEPVLRTGRNGSFLLWLWPEVLEWGYKSGRLRPRPPNKSRDSL